MSLRKRCFGQLSKIFGEYAVVLDLKHSNPPQFSTAYVSENAWKRASLVDFARKALIPPGLPEHLCPGFGTESWEQNRQSSLPSGAHPAQGPAHFHMIQVLRRLRPGTRLSQELLGQGTQPTQLSEDLLKPHHSKCALWSRASAHLGA